jgi:hypothetical protein
MIKKDKNNGKMPQLQKRQVSVYLTKSTYHKVKNLADDSKRRMSNMIEVLIEQQLTKDGK